MSLEAIKLKGIHLRAKIDQGHLCQGEENLSFYQLNATFAYL
jgi:hypothetical protein